MSKTYFCGPFTKTLPVKVDEKCQLLKHMVSRSGFNIYCYGMTNNECIQNHFYDEPYLRFICYLPYFITANPELKRDCENGDVVEVLSAFLLNTIRNIFPVYSSQYFKMLINEQITNDGYLDHGIEMIIGFTSKGIEEFDNLYSLYKLYSSN